MKTLPACFLAVLLLPAARPVHAADDRPDPPSITVSGAAEIEAEPDYIEWTITLADNHVDPVKAKQANDQRHAAVLELAKDLDIKRADAVDGLVSIRRTYEQTDRGGRGAFKDYEVRRTIVLVQRELDDFDQMLEQLAAARVEFSLEYGTSELERLKREARGRAVKAAQDKAEEMAGELDQEVGRPLRITELSSGAGFDLSNALSNTVSTEVGNAGAGARRGAISVRCSVQVVFLLSPE